MDSRNQCGIRLQSSVEHQLGTDAMNRYWPNGARVYQLPVLTGRIGVPMVAVTVASEV